MRLQRAKIENNGSFQAYWHITVKVRDSQILCTLLTESRLHTLYAKYLEKIPRLFGSGLY